MRPDSTSFELDDIDRRIINNMQGDFPVSDTPYAEMAQALDLSEDLLLARVQHLVQAGALSRFGPIFNAEKMGGGLTLAAMEVPEDEFDRVAEIVNSYREVAHNYKRENRLNMWFVVATESPEEIDRVLSAIESATDLRVYNLPKKQEFFLGLKITV